MKSSMMVNPLRFSYYLNYCLELGAIDKGTLRFWQRAGWIRFIARAYRTGP